MPSLGAWAEADPTQSQSCAEPQRRDSGLTHHGSDHQVAIGLLALAKRLDFVTVTEMLVDELALDRVHCRESNRTTLAHGRLDSLISRRAKRIGAAGSISGGVDHNRLTRAGTRKGGSVGEMLDRVEGATVVSDQELGKIGRASCRERV